MKKISKYQYILPTLLAIAQRHPRFRQDYEWYDTSFIGNFFVFWKKLFWEPCGPNGVGDHIKADALTIIGTDEDGRRVEIRRFYKWEVLFVYIESVLWQYLKNPRIKLEFQFVPIPVLALAGARSEFRLPIFNFAIAFDVTTVGGSATPAISQTFNHTTASGSNRIMIGYAQINSGSSITGVTYNAVSMTVFQEVAGGPGASVWSLFAPATGTKSAVFSSGSANIAWCYTTTYSGVKQSGFPDATGTGSPQSATTDTVNCSTTTVADNAWVIWCASKNNGNVIGSLSNAVSRGSGDNNSTYLDTNAVVTPAGTITQSGTAVLNTWRMIYFSIAPAVATATTAPGLLPMMGIG